MTTILNETIDSDANGYWQYNFNPQSPGNYQIEITPVAADGTTMQPYFKNIIVTQDEIDKLNLYKYKRYIDIHDISLSSLNTEISSIELMEIPKSKIYPGEQDIRNAIIIFNQSYYYTEGGDSTIYLTLYETNNPLNVLNRYEVTTTNQDDNYADEDDPAYDPNVKSYIDNIALSPKVLMQYESVSIKMMRKAYDGTITDIYDNTIKVKEYLGPYNDGKKLQEFGILTHTDYRLATLKDIVSIGYYLPHMIITRVDGAQLNIKQIYITFEIYIAHTDPATGTIIEQTTLHINNNIIDYNLDLNDKAHAIKPRVLLPYIHEGTITVVIHGINYDDTEIEIAKIGYNWI